MGQNFNTRAVGNDRSPLSHRSPLVHSIIYIPSCLPADCDYTMKLLPLAALLALLGTPVVSFTCPRPVLTTTSHSSSSLLAMAKKSKSGGGKNKGFAKTTEASTSSSSATTTTTTTTEASPPSLSSPKQDDSVTTSTTSTSATMNAGQRALAEMRRQKAQEEDAELRKARELMQIDQQVAETPAAIPEQVAQRMGMRMLPFVGLPLFLGMGAFVGFWYFATYKNMEFQPVLVAGTTIGMLVIGLLVRITWHKCIVCTVQSLCFYLSLCVFVCQLVKLACVCVILMY